MGRVFMKQFRAIQHKGVNPCDFLNDEASVFCSSVTEDLQKLGNSVVGSFVSLRWSTEAMNLLKSMHVKLLIFAKKSNVPISSDGENWLDHYMKVSAMLLDLCNLLKSATSGIQRYQMVVDFSIKKFSDNPSIAKNMIEIQELEKESSQLFYINKWRDVRLGRILQPQFDKSTRGINPFMFAFKSVVIIISLLLVSIFIYPVSIEMGGEIGHEFPQLKHFTSLLNMLVYQLRERIRRKPGESSSPVLVEQELVERVVADLKGQFGKGMVEDREKFLGSVGLLKMRSTALKEGLEMFDCAVGEVFGEVIQGRTKLLEMFSSNIV